jgi:CheY-like chemotaxis protein
MRPILFATDNSTDVYNFWLVHKQCGIGNPVEIFADGREVITYLQAWTSDRPLPALLVASRWMPHMGGLQLLQNLKAKDQAVFPTVILIDHQEHDLPLIAAAFQLGVDSFLRRPIVKKEFCELMSRIETVTMEGCGDIDASLEPKIRRFDNPLSPLIAPSLIGKPGSVPGGLKKPGAPCR